MLVLVFLMTRYLLCKKLRASRCQPFLFQQANTKQRRATKGKGGSGSVRWSKVLKYYLGLGMVGMCF